MKDEKLTLRDKFWLWGHPEGCYNNLYGNNQPSRMTPMEFCLYLGIHNTFMVPDKWEVNRRQYNKSFTTLRNVGWECFGMHERPEIIDEAIESERKIKFDYNKYGADKKMHRSAIHTVSPYQMILHNQRYYLMGYNEKWQHIQYYRMDRITDIELLENSRTPLKSIPGYENGIDYKRFSSSMPYMFFDEPQMIEFLADGWAIDQIVDWFGKDIFIEERQDGRLLVTLRASVNAMEYWAMQYMNAVEILSPKDLRERIKKNIQTANEKYKE